MRYSAPRSPLIIRHSFTDASSIAFASITPTPLLLLLRYALPAIVAGADAAAPHVAMLMRAVVMLMPFSIMPDARYAMSVA